MGLTSRAMPAIQIQLLGKKCRTKRMKRQVRMHCSGDNDGGDSAGGDNDIKPGVSAPTRRPEDGATGDLVNYIVVMTR